MKTEIQVERLTAEGREDAEIHRPIVLRIIRGRRVNTAFLTQEEALEIGIELKRAARDPAASAEIYKVES